jgi:hypothetical protein
MPVSRPGVVVLCGRSAALCAGVHAAKARQARVKTVKLRIFVFIENILVLTQALNVHANHIVPGFPVQENRKCASAETTAK